MNSIGASQLFQTSQTSPRDLVQQQLNQQLASGEISSADKEALTKSIDAIGKSIKASLSGGSGFPRPGEIKSKITDLISKQVESGDLTQDQADELTEVFEDTFSKGPGGLQGHARGGGGIQDILSLQGGNQKDAISDFLKLLQEQDANRYDNNGSSFSGKSDANLFDFLS